VAGQGGGSGGAVSVAAKAEHCPLQRWHNPRSEATVGQEGAAAG
jgi:hypothetical protein